MKAKPHPASWRMHACALAALGLLAWPAQMAVAKSKKARAAQPVEEVLVDGRAATPAAPDAPTAPNPAQTRTISLSMKQMGAWSAVTVRGADGSRTLGFSVRADEMVVGARLKLLYDYSPALIPEWSHLRVLMNEKVAEVIPLPAGKHLANNREIALDPRLFADNNFLRLNLIGHYTRQCENLFHSSLWLTVSDLSRLELTLAPKSVVNDLKYLPAPFFDRREDGSLKLPFVFLSPPAPATLKAAGVVASWFGIKAGTRGAQFSAQLGSLPDADAVLILRGGEKLPGVEVAPGATLSVITHPTNPRRKLLVVSGANDDELMRAARALALAPSTLAGPSITLGKDTFAAPRKPYDAPAWVPLDRPVKLGELVRTEELQASGWYPEPIRVNYRVSPDVFTWRTPGVPMQLKYRYTRLPEHRNSSLNVSLNNTFIHALALNTPYRNPEDTQRLNQPASENLSRQDVFLPLPPYTLGGRDQLQFAYHFDIVQRGECQNMPPENLQGVIDPESTLDFSGFPHFIAMPNLAAFASLGFPFTRMADLSETVVVLPDQPNPQELGTYLTLMGRMGESTGYPVLGHTPVKSSEADKEPDRDLLVIGSGNSQPLLNKWAEHLPVVQINGERRVREPDATWLPNYRWEGKDVHRATDPRGDLKALGGGNLTTLMGFESPLKAGRSVVLVHADQASDLRKIDAVLTDPERLGSVHGDLAVVGDKDLAHTKVSPTYYVGKLNWRQKAQWYLNDHPVWVSVGALLAALLIAALGYVPVRRLLLRRRTQAS